MSTSTATDGRTTATPPARRWFRRVWSLLSLVSLLGSLLLALPPSLGGRTTYTMVSGASMEPTYHTYDLAITYRGADPVRGDVIVYRVPEGDPGAGGQVIHRVTGGNAVEGYITQGDNREGPDIWKPRRRDVVGTVVLLVPKGGLVMVKFLNMANIGLFGLGFLAWALWPRRDEDSEGDALTGSPNEPADAPRRRVCI